MKHFLTFLLIASLGTAGAETTDELIEQLKAAVKAEAKTARNKNDGANQQRFYQLQQLLLQLNRSNTEGQGEYNLPQTIEAIGSIVSSEKVEEICRTLAPQLRAEAEKREATLAEEMEKGLAAALRAGLAGKTIKDLDAPMVAVSRLIQESNNRQTNNPKLRNLNSQAQQLAEFLRQWQDYLAGLDTGDGQSSRQRLQNLLNSSRDFSAFIPRSELLAHLSELQKQHGVFEEQKNLTSTDIETKGREIVHATKTLQEIPQALQQLQILATTPRAGGMASGLINQYINTLSNYQLVYAQLLQGATSNVNLGGVFSGLIVENNASVLALRNQLLLFTLQRLLNQPENQAAKPDENVPAYLQRIAALAREKADWTLLGRTVDVAQTFNINTGSIIYDRAAVQAFLAGLNQERAQQYAFAVASFLAALKTGSQILPVEVVGERLEAIRKEHPEDYEQGSRMAVAIPTIGDPRYPRGDNPLVSPFPSRSPVTAPPAPPLPPAAVPKAN
jgi:hypothetical protein